MEKHCSLCGAEMLLDKVFPGKMKVVKRRERYKCTDNACNNEETIQPENEENAVYKEIVIRKQVNVRKYQAKQLEE